jgi:hypothetical protein
MLPGGPSIVVAFHPRTGQQCYIPVQMLPGAPQVHYTGHKIEYDYGRHGICISFGLFGEPKVTYRNSVPVSRRAKNLVMGTAGGFGKLAEKSGLSELAKRGAEGAKSVAVNTKNGIHDLGQQLCAPAIGLLNTTPLGSVFRSDLAEQARRARDAEIRRAARQAANAGISLPTVR